MHTIKLLRLAAALAVLGTATLWAAGPGVHSSASHLAVAKSPLRLGPLPPSEPAD